MAKTSQARFEQAEAARAEGNIWLASQLYLRVALTRPENKHTAEAKEALADFREEGQQKLDELAAEISGSNCRESLETLDDLAADYEYVPVVGDAIELKRNRVRREYAAILNEPAAAELLAVAAQHEADGELCCAYLAYREAAKLAPAPSGIAAKERFRALDSDPEIASAAQACQQLRRCHDKYRVAERYAEADPEHSTRLFQEIVETAPPESDVYRSAREKLAMLGR